MTSVDIEVVLTEELHRIAPDIEIATIDRGEDLRDEFDIDSMDFLNLVTVLSKRLGSKIPESDYPRMGTFDGIIDYLREIGK